MNKKSLLLAVAVAALVSGCVSTPKSTTRTPQKKEVKEPTRVRVPLTAEQESAAKAAVRSSLKDPGSAEFYDLYGAKDPKDETIKVSYCGQVNAKNSYGGYVGRTPFIVLGDKALLWERRPKYGYSMNNSLIDDICKTIN
jgi:uncharacterized protein YceK